MNSLHAITVTAVLAAITVGASACNTGPFSGSGAMRIEVEVYKGPLSQEPEIQWGELVGYLEEAKRSLISNMNFTLAVVENKDFKTLVNGVEPFDANSNPYLLGPTASVRASPTQPSISGTAGSPNIAGTYLYPPKEVPKPATPFYISWCDNLDPEGAWDQLDYFDCIILRGIYTEGLDLFREVNTLLTTYEKLLHDPSISTSDATRILREVSEFSSKLRAKGFHWAVSTTAGQSFSTKIKIALVHFVVTTSEFGNQLQSRADTLMKQFQNGGHDRRELPLSSHLRETEPTDFVQLYNWLGASTDTLRYKLPEFFFTGVWPTSAGERVKIVNRLFADHFWSRINTVYASGKGQVGMAFVKDDLGNWNLKNFDNAPGELLDAYMTLTTSLVKKAADLAAGVSTAGGSEALKAGPEALKMIQGFVNEAQAVHGSMQASSSEAEARSRLKALESKTATALNALSIEREKQDQDLNEELKAKTGTPEEGAIRARLVAHRQHAVTEFDKVITGYKQQVELLEKASSSVRAATEVSKNSPVREIVQ